MKKEKVEDKKDNKSCKNCFYARPDLFLEGCVKCTLMMWVTDERDCCDQHVKWG